MEMDLQYNQYLVKMDGSRRTTTRNRRFQRKIWVTELVNERARLAMRPVGDMPQWDNSPAEVAPRPASTPGTPDTQPGGTPATPAMLPATHQVQTRTTPSRPANGAGHRQTGCRLPAAAERDSAIAKAALHTVWSELCLNDVDADKTAEVLAKVAVILMDY